MARYKFHSNEFGVSVHFGGNTVMLTCRQIRLGKDTVYESPDGMTVQDISTGTRIFIPRQVVGIYKRARDAAINERIGIERYDETPTGKKTIRGP